MSGKLVHHHPTHANPPQVRQAVKLKKEIVSDNSEAVNLSKKTVSDNSEAVKLAKKTV